MLTVEHDKKKLQNYENLQKEYKVLLDEYEDIKSNNSKDPKLEEKIKELTIKQKEIQDLSSKLS
ncbi:hypothetical protein C6990_08235 [Nitrosopumilus sp. b3]|uniref:hypothetical protein n=1 Tax=Nitrosopumilus sp. b3 TaxID=2109909 RepID=UPI0015F36721|nr:hypothetical protein [Nitrosopumilus sp. b3]KAF6246487.1 hypothetical protein C6990_08235 [Nitrosopumilus sp. b3]